MGLTLPNDSTNFQDNPSGLKVRMTSPTRSNQRFELKMGASSSRGAPTTQSFPSLSIHNGRVKETRIDMFTRRFSSYGKIESNLNQEQISSFGKWKENAGKVVVSCLYYGLLGFTIQMELVL